MRWTMRYASSVRVRWAALILVLGCDAQSHTGASNSSAGTAATNAQSGGSQTRDAGVAGSRDAGSDAERVHADGAVQILRRSCTFDPLPADWSLEPGWECATQPGMPGRLECVPGIHCTHSDECDARPFGRCLGYGHTTCDYGLSRTSCTVDADCTELPDGRCVPELLFGERCFPLGQCEPLGPYCLYPELQQDCTEDADCKSLQGGHCVRAVTHSTCQYNNQCAADDDCAATERCACVGSGDLGCVPADCKTDDDCQRGERCATVASCAGTGIAGYHCTSAADECLERDDCAAGYCGLDPNTGTRACMPQCLVP